MRKFNTAIVGAAAAALLLATPVSATPLAGAMSNTASHAVIGAVGVSNVIQVKSKAERRAERLAKKRRAERRTNRRRLRGHRGQRNRRRGYRRHSDGWWYPLAAFAIGSAIVNSADRGSRHEEWCEEQYRSYRVRDNTFQPYNGPRRQCNSPY